MNNIKKYNKRLFECTIKNVNSLSFSDNFFLQLAKTSKIDEANILMLFPGGIKQFVFELEEYCDQLTITKLLLYIKKDSTARVRDKIKQGILYRMKVGDEQNRVFLSKLNGFYSIPKNYDLFLKVTWSIANGIWSALGDKSTDFNYYTKRTILGAVYQSTLCYYVQDQSDKYNDTLDFLDNSIEKVMNIKRIKNNTSLFSRLKKKIPFVRLMKI